jgi:hypothetical protein
MFPSLPMASRVQGSHILWEPQAQTSRTILGRWVIPLPIPTYSGVIPRAARSLFNKLAAEYNHDKPNHSGRTPSASGIRPPSRLSMQLSPTPTGVKPKIHKSPPSNKEWTLTATYVEVRPPFAQLISRSITTSSGTSYYPSNYNTKNVCRSPSAKIQKEISS